jgi:hypothetical protein
MAKTKTNGKLLHRYKVLRRIDVSERLPSGETLTTVYLPKEEGVEKPKAIDAEALGIPSVLATDSGLSLVQLRVDLSGEVVLSERPSLDLIRSETLAPLTDAEREALAKYLKGRSARTITPILS